MKYVWMIIFVGCIGMSCGKPQDPISWDTQEQARQMANDNLDYNAKAFRNAYYPEYHLRMRGDSSIDGKCKQGDGWGSIDLLPKEGQAGVIKIKCSTVSATIGCMTEEDFKQRPQYSNQDGHCNAELPFPLPKLNK